MLNLCCLPHYFICHLGVGLCKEIVLTFVFPNDYCLKVLLEGLSVFRLLPASICPRSLSEAAAKLSLKLFALGLLAFFSESCQVTVKAEASD